MFGGGGGERALQRGRGHPMETLTAGEVHGQVPEIDKLDGVAGATFSPHDGLINPNLLKEHYRHRALKLGAQFLDRAFVVSADVGNNGARLEAWQSDDPLTDAGLARMMTQHGPGEAEPGRMLSLHPH